MSIIEKARYIVETNPGYTEEGGPTEGGRVGFAIGDRVFWTDAYFQDPLHLFAVKREYAEAIVKAINDGLLFQELETARMPDPPQMPAGGIGTWVRASPDLPPGWNKWDGKAPPKLYSPIDWITVMFKDRTEQKCTKDFDWMADRGDNPIIAWFDEIPF